MTIRPVFGHGALAGRRVGRALDGVFPMCSHVAMTALTSAPPRGTTPGRRLARGVCRLLLSLDMMPVVEFVPERGLRVDVMALGRRGEIWVVECKSSRADLVADRKWQGYLPWCDRFFFAVPSWDRPATELSSSLDRSPLG